MPDWNPALYSRFENERTRPARDLLAAVQLDRPGLLVDLGCGPGNSTELLAHRFPSARVLGIDSSPAMIATARSRLPQYAFEQGDITSWKPPTAPDLIFANAVLQWLPDHAALFPALLAKLKPGGVLAVQMPDNLDEPSHRAMRALASEPPWAENLAKAVASRTSLPPLNDYYNRLCLQAGSVAVWRTTYHHPMSSPGAIVDWLRSTGLKPFLDALRGDQHAEFIRRFKSRIDEAYPAQADGQRLLAFPRIFIVATRRP